MQQAGGGHRTGTRHGHGARLFRLEQGEYEHDPAWQYQLLQMAKGAGGAAHVPPGYLLGSPARTVVFG